MVLSSFSFIGPNSVFVLIFELLFVFDELFSVNASEGFEGEFLNGLESRVEERSVPDPDDCNYYYRWVLP